jgi:predicted sulfurtransferase
LQVSAGELKLSQDAHRKQLELASSDGGPQIRVTSLYQFTRFGDCRELQSALKLACGRRGVRGTLILAAEGINGTIAGTSDAVEEVIAFIRSLPGCERMPVKDSQAGEMPFHRMKVKIKKEIVTMGEPGISPLDGVGRYVEPAAWNDLISDPNTIVIDTRNAYEIEIGTFRNAVDPGTKSFRAPLVARPRPHAEDRHVLHRRNSLRESDSIAEGGGNRRGLSPQRRHPEIS